MWMCIVGFAAGIRFRTSKQISQDVVFCACLGSGAGFACLEPITNQTSSQEAQHKQCLFVS